MVVNSRMCLNEACILSSDGLLRSIGKYCSSNTRNAMMNYMYSVGGKMLIKYRSTQNADLHLRYRLRSFNSYFGSIYSSYC